jgi:hypothetical protein
METVNNIEDVFFPDNGNLNLKDGQITTTLVDCELDEYECTFLSGKIVEIKTEGYSTISLDVKILKNLIRLIEDAEKIYEEI